MIQPCRNLREFPPDLLKALLHTLETRCESAVVLDPEEIASEEGRARLLHKAGRHSVVNDVKNALASAEKDAAKILEREATDVLS